MIEGKSPSRILAGMERRSFPFQLVAVMLIVVGLVTLAAPAPAHAMDPQLILALASAAGAVALIVGYLIVSNSREKQKTASLEGIYACSAVEESGPMGCGSPLGRLPVSVAVPSSDRTPESPMVADGRGSSSGAVSPADGPMVGDGRGVSRVAADQSYLPSCPGGRPAGPMGCDGPAAAPSRAFASDSTSAPRSDVAVAIQH